MKPKILNEIPTGLHKDQLVSIDCEFFGQTKTRLHRPHGTFACISIAVEGRNELYQLYDTKDLKKLFQSLKSCQLVGHNMMYDLKQLMAYVEIKPRTVWDTMLVEQSMFGGYYQHFSLRDLVRRYFGVVLNKEVRDDFSEREEMDKDMKEYAAMDAYWTLRVAEQQQEYKDSPGFAAYRDIDEKMIWPLLDIQGIPVDTAAWEKAVTGFEATASELQNTLGFNVNSAPQVMKACASAGVHIQDTRAATLEGYKDKQLIADILTTRMYRKAASTYGRKWLEKYVEEDGKVYPSWHIIGAECLPTGELVLTNRGYIQVEKVRVGDSVITHKGRTRKVSDVFINGTKRIYEISTASGLTLRTTGNHPYLTPLGWKIAQELKIGDEVLAHSGPERWKEILNWEKFSVSSWGRVRNNLTGRYLTQQPKGAWGHLKVMLHRNGAQERGEDRKDFSVHRLVASAFIENEDGLPEVRHLNGLAWDNTVDNLLWGTRQDNIKDAVLHGSMEKQSKSLFTPEDVQYIRTAVKYTGFDGVMASKYGVSRECIRDIRTGKRWKDYSETGKSVSFHADTVSSMDVQDEEITYGLTIDEDASHVTGGIVTHNTGRMSSANPNGQNIPQRKLPIYRTFFTASPGNRFIVDDVAQQEPCILAYESKDRILTKAIIDGEDLHLTVAREIFNDPKMEKADPRRAIGKMINLGTSYGLSEHGLSARLNIPLEEAQQFLQQYFSRFTGVFTWISLMRQQAYQNGYVRTALGRRIYLNTYDNQWQNNAINAPIQGGAADFTKMWVRKYWEKCNEQGIPYTLCLVVHDEIGMDCPKEAVKDTNRIRKEAFTETAETLFKGIPFKSEFEMGKSWACKSIKEEAITEEEDE